ncbi:MAG: efflux RND transporter periplasmic adaptor subunit [Treponema sp.]|jgi:multidrug efflux pump subunit AcrA (membrane-fusion protein)|nr:efflux RND transporter periplasmic adaptor subunit [Treponema sp.]
MKSKTVKGIGIFIGTVIAAGALFFLPSLLAGGNEPQAAAGAEPAVSAVSVKIAEAEIRSLRRRLEVNGDVRSVQQVEVFPEASGKLASVRAVLGSSVRRGEIVAEVDPSRPGVQFMRSPVYAPISGTVSRTPLSVGTTVSTGDSVMTISLAENLEVMALIPEGDIGGLALGLKADIFLRAFPGESFSAAVTHIAPVLDPVSRTKMITLSFDRPDSRINAGMFARIALTTGTYDNIIVVPAEALIDRFGVTAVYVLNGSRAGLREVSTGVTIDRLTEIRSGIVSGEKVIVQGQQFISDGSVVRVAGSEGVTEGGAR